MTAPVATASFGFALKTLFCQGLAISSAILVWPLLPSLAVTLATATVVALVTARFLQLPSAWLVVNSAFPIAAASSLSLALPSWIFLIPLGGLVLTYAPALWTRVPYYPTHRAAYALVLAELPLDRPFVFLDIGCGFGDLLFFLASKRPNGTFVGIEIGPLPWAFASMKNLIDRYQTGQRNVSVRCKDMWSYPLQGVDYVYTFLSPAAMERVWTKARGEMTPGSIFITNSFPVPAPSHEEIEVKDPRGGKLYIHRM